MYYISFWSLTIILWIWILNRGVNNFKFYSKYELAMIINSFSIFSNYNYKTCIQDDLHQHIFFFLQWLVLPNRNHMYWKDTLCYSSIHKKWTFMAENIKLIRGIASDNKEKTNSDSSDV